MGWLVLIYRLPSNDPRARVAVWRELRRSGALHVQQSVVAVPDAGAFTEDVERLREVLADVGGQLTALRTEPLAAGDDSRLLSAWNEARDAEYRELVGECAKFLAEIDHEFEIEKFTLAELDEEEAELDKLERWHERISRLDVHAAEAGPGAVKAMRDAEAALARYSAEVYERTQP
jgi:ChrB-like protein